MFRLPVAALTGMVALAPLMAIAEDARIWSYLRYVEADPANTVVNLGYGIPQTDDVQATMLCVITADGVRARVAMALGVEGLATDAPVVLDLAAPAFSGQIEGRVVRHEEFLFGVEAELPLDHGLWSALMGGGVMAYGIAGRPGLTLPLDGATDPTHDFVGDCLSIRDLVPDAPVPVK